MGQEMLSQSQSSQDTEIRSNRSGFDMIKMKTGIQERELLQATNMMPGQLSPMSSVTPWAYFIHSPFTALEMLQMPQCVVKSFEELHGFEV